MIKKGIKASFVFFVLLTAWRWLNRSDFSWSEQIGMSIVFFIVYLLMEWTSESPQNKKDERFPDER